MEKSELVWLYDSFERNEVIKLVRIDSGERVLGIFVIKGRRQGSRITSGGLSTIIQDSRCSVQDFYDAIESAPGLAESDRKDLIAIVRNARREYAIRKARAETAVLGYFEEIYPSTAQTSLGLNYSFSIKYKE